MKAKVVKDWLIGIVYFLAPTSMQNINFILQEM